MSGIQTGLGSAGFACKECQGHELSSDSLMNLTGCSDLSQVESLQLHVNTHIDALPTLGLLLPRLRRLDLEGSTLTSIRDLGTSLTALTHLKLDRCALTELDGIESFDQLQTLSIRWNAITDISPLSMHPALQELHADGTAVQAVDSLDYLASLSKLQTLNLQYTPLSAHKNYRCMVGKTIPQLMTLDEALISSAERLSSVQADLDGNDIDEDTLDYVRLLHQQQRTQHQQQRLRGQCTAPACSASQRPQTETTAGPACAVESNAQSCMTPRHRVRSTSSRVVVRASSLTNGAPGKDGTANAIRTYGTHSPLSSRRSLSPSFTAVNSSVTSLSDQLTVTTCSSSLDLEDSSAGLSSFSSSTSSALRTFVPSPPVANKPTSPSPARPGAFFTADKSIKNPHERPVSHGSTAQQPDQASSRSSSSQSARVDAVSRPRTAYTESSKCVEEDDSDMLSHHGSEDSTSQPLTARSYTARPVSAMRRPRTALARPMSAARLRDVHSSADVHGVSDLSRTAPLTLGTTSGSVLMAHELLARLDRLGSSGAVVGIDDSEMRLYSSNTAGIAEADASSSLTYGSDSVICGNFAAALRSRRRKDSTPQQQPSPQVLSRSIEPKMITLDGVKSSEHVGLYVQKHVA